MSTRERPVRGEQPVPRFFLALIIAAIFLLGWVIKPLAAELFLAAVLGGILWPTQERLTRKLRGRRSVAAALLTVATFLLILGPLATIATFIIRDGADAVRFVSDTARGEHMTNLVDMLPDTAGEVVRDAIAKIPHDLGEAMGQVGAIGGGRAAAVGKAAAAMSANAALFVAFMLIGLYFFLLQGDQFVSWLDSVSPLRRGQTRELLYEFKKVSYAVITSTVITSAVQALAALVGYVIARVPNPVFFAVITFFVAFVPAIGAGAACLVAALLLFVTGHPYMAGFLAAWGVVVVGLVDNLVKPLLIRRGMELHGAVVFFALVGGIAAFGAIGLLVGPLVVAAFLALVRMYHRDFTPGDHRELTVPGLAPEPRPGGGLLPPET